MAKKVLTKKSFKKKEIVREFFKKFSDKRFLVGLATVILLGAILFLNKSLFVVAIVNGRPILRMDFEKRMIARAGNQILEESVNEAIIRQEASKRGIKVTNIEVDNKVKEIEKSLEGRISLSDALAAQGLTQESFRSQLELPLLVEKMTADQIVVSDNEVSDYIGKNKASLLATDEAGLKDEAKKAIYLRKKEEVFQSFFEELKKNSKVVSLL